MLPAQQLVTHVTKSFSVNNDLEKKIWYLHRIVVTMTGVRCLTVRVTIAGAHVVLCFGRVNVSTVECKQTHATYIL